MRKMEGNFINERNRVIARENLLEAYGIKGASGTDDYDFYLKDGYLIVMDKRTNTVFESCILVQDSKKITIVLMHDSRCEEVKTVIADGDESLILTRDFLPSSVSNEPYLSRVDYTKLGDCDFRHTYCTGNEKSNIIYCVKSGIPKLGASINFDKPRAYRALYRLKNGNINSFTEYLHQPKDDNIWIEGGCYQVFDKEQFDTSTNYEVENRTKRIFRNLNFDSIKSAILYTGYSNSNGVITYYVFNTLKTKDGISIEYSCYDTKSKSPIDYITFVLPRLSSTEINKAEIDSLISSLQEKISNNIFINIVIGELNRFAEELSRKKGDSPKIADSMLSPRHLDSQSMEDILRNSDTLLAAAREELSEMITISGNKTKKLV